MRCFSTVNHVICHTIFCTQVAGEAQLSELLEVERISE